MRRGAVEHGDPLGVARWHGEVLGVGAEGAVLEGPQHVEPRLADAVHEVAVQPRRDVVQLQHKRYQRSGKGSHHQDITSKEQWL